MAGEDRDWLVRQAAFRFVEELTIRHGDVLPWEPLRDGFDFDGTRITLVGVRGIWKPQALNLPISIRTSPKNPYGDEASEDGFLHYRYFGDDAGHPDNAGLRECFERGLPLIYFSGIEPGWYAPVWPLVLVNDDPGSLTVVGACEDVEALRPDVTVDAAAVARRRYVTRLALVRLHQTDFRRRVLSAYRRSCTVCRLRHPELLDAAHIISDRTELGGEPVVPNGLAMCKIHHAAFDRNIFGVRPDHMIEIRTDILQERDGPMLKHGLQELHGGTIVVPHRPADQPDQARLEARFEEYREAI
ncbi:MAG: HNH endonuclease [Acidimicrobiia bacterium]